ncbi:TatD family deoxyribonuclease [Duganella sp. FT80W]|uniref:TatD family deoxyribonuclease n=1 Tax=Duganella guangzhouensis TaxID=2666084 RepID=A0A6I2L5Y4_9BURK|nr:TatD family hydrolase [Duganella guangzhouensis]MRW93685.1 TatD family deoxyribonuclease [Duganella guangzhouensis]
MWIDTHCHLDAHEFGSESAAQAALARRQGVEMIVMPAVETANFPIVAQLAASVDNACYALGIHPIYVPNAVEDDLRVLRETVAAAMADARFVAIGEIGLDFFIPMLTEPAMREKQVFFFREQLKIAREFGLPVLMHVRRSQDVILKHVRQIAPAGGIAHAFNGSEQQARTYIELGFKLGFGGAMTFTRALQIRRLAAELPLEAIVLETDAPDISPAWVHPGRNSPDQIPRIGAVLAELRGLTPEQIAAATTANAHAAIPRLTDLVG